MKKKLPKVIDLFCGAGGMSLGFKQAGFPIAAGFDYDEKALETYNFNFINKGHHYNLAEIDGIQIRKITGLKKMDDCIIIAGPPCQGFSSVNGRKESSLEKNNFVIRTAELIKEIKPTFFVVENVLQMRNLNDGKYFNKFLEIIEEAGYKFKDEILNAVKHGVPQKRRRIFIIGSNNGHSIEFPEGNDKIISVKDAISDLPYLYWKKEGKNPIQYDKEAKTQFQKEMRKNSSDLLYNHIITKNTEKIIDRYKLIEPGESYRDAKHRMKREDHISVHYGNVYRKFVGSEPAPALANPRKSMYIHFRQNRGLSVREVARLQSFPDDFIFKSSKSYQQQQVANAVPPLLAKQIALKFISEF